MRDSVVDIMLGAWWKICLSVITMIVLGYMMIDNIRTNSKENYRGYETWFVISLGWVAAVLTLFVGIAFSMKRQRVS